MASSASVFDISIQISAQLINPDLFQNLTWWQKYHISRLLKTLESEIPERSHEVKESSRESHPQREMYFELKRIFSEIAAHQNSKVISRAIIDLEIFCRDKSHPSYQHCLYALGLCHRFGLGGLKVDLNKTDALWILPDQAIVKHSRADYFEHLLTQEGNSYSGFGRSLRETEEIGNEIKDSLEKFSLSLYEHDSYAQYQSGILHLKGLKLSYTYGRRISYLASYEAISINIATAVLHFKKAAHQGDPLAQWKLGELYEEGVGLEKNTANAVALYSCAASQGFPPAQFALARCYMNNSAKHIDAIPAALRLYQESSSKPFKFEDFSNTDGLKKYEEIVKNRDKTRIAITKCLIFDRTKKNLVPIPNPICYLISDYSYETESKGSGFGRSVK